jgi:hypothetical protein
MQSAPLPVSLSAASPKGTMTPNPEAALRRTKVKKLVALAAVTALATTGCSVMRIGPEEIGSSSPVASTKQQLMSDPSTELIQPSDIGTDWQTYTPSNDLSGCPADDQWPPASADYATTALQNSDGTEQAIEVLTEWSTDATAASTYSKLVHGLGSCGTIQSGKVTKLGSSFGKDASSLNVSPKPAQYVVFRLTYPGGGTTSFAVVRQTHFVLTVSFATGDDSSGSYLEEVTVAALTYIPSS